MRKEHWRTIPDSHYMISNLGTIKNPQGKAIKPNTTGSVKIVSVETGKSFHVLLRRIGPEVWGDEFQLPAELRPLPPTPPPAQVPSKGDRETVERKVVRLKITPPELEAVMQSGTAILAYKMGDTDAPKYPYPCWPIEALGLGSARHSALCAAAMQHAYELEDAMLEEVR